MRTRHGSKRRQIEKASQVTSETRRCTEDLVVPTDLVSEILRRLPAKSVGRFLLVSKLWATIIRSPYFVRSFPFRSSLQPHVLLAFKYLDNQNGRLNWNFHSYSSTSTKQLPAYHLSSRTTCSSSIPHHLLWNISKVPYYVNGLISIGCGREQLICNPSTGKTILLPKVKSRKVIIRSFFGYDPVDSQYKVLCMSEKVYHCWAGNSSLEHQVFTLGGVDKSWRMIECNMLNKRPRTNGVCIDGVVYYGADRAPMISEWCLVRFNVRSEKFDDQVVVQYMGDYSPLSYRDISLMSYKGKVTFAIEITQQRFESLILEDIEKREWSKICIFINPVHSLVGHVQIIRETTHTGEIVFVWHHLEDLYMLFHDHETNSYRTIKVQRNLDEEFGRFSLMIPFFSYVESVMLL